MCLQDSQAQVWASTHPGEGKGEPGLTGPVQQMLGRMGVGGSLLSGKAARPGPWDPVPAPSFSPHGQS